MRVCLELASLEAKFVKLDKAALSIRSLLAAKLSLTPACASRNRAQA